MPKKPCITTNCPGYATSGPRCKACATRWDATRTTRRAPQRQAAYGGSWRRNSERIRKEWVASKGWVCPGYGPHHPPHPSTDLVVDHDLGVMCRAANGIKAATVDRHR